MDQSRVSQGAAKFVLSVLAIFAMLFFTIAGVSIIENGTPTARLQIPGTLLPG
jgi:hypothetical protein